MWVVVDATPLQLRFHVTAVRHGTYYRGYGGPTEKKSCLRRYTLNYKYEQYSHYLVNNKTFHGSRYDK